MTRRSASLQCAVARRLLLAVALALLSLAGAAADYYQPVPIDTTLARAALDPALMCAAIYHNCQVYGWNGPALQIGDRSTFDPVSGLDAGVYEREEDGVRDLVLCFRGTSSGADWKTDFEQALGEVPEQYHQALNLGQAAIILATQGTGAPARITFTGHSLGGGLAAFAGIFWRQRAFCFGSAPLAGGTQRQLREVGESRLQAAPQYVTHFFIEGDRVPGTATLFGQHFGRVVEPPLAPPANFSGVQPDHDRLNLLSLAGLNSRGHVRVNPLDAVRLGVDALARHSMENYVGALAAHLPQESSGLALVGVWKSQGSFFQLTTSTTWFTLTANGRLVLLNELQVLGDNLRLSDTGRWQFDGRTLGLNVAGLAELRYELVGAAPDRAIQWRRAGLEPDVPAIEASLRRAGNHDPHAAAVSTALLLKTGFRLMQDKVVTWQREANSP